MSKRIVCPKCNAVIIWNEQDSITRCKLCGTQYKMKQKHNQPQSKNQQQPVSPVLMPSKGRGVIDYLTVPNNNDVRNRPLIQSYIPKNWTVKCGFLTDRIDMIDHIFIPYVEYNSPQNEVKICFTGESFYKHIELTPQTAQFNGKLDDYIINHSSPSFRRLRSFMNAKSYCDYLAQSTGASEITFVSYENPTQEELNSQMNNCNFFVRQGFSNVNAEWTRRIYSARDRSRSKLIITAESRVFSMEMYVTVPTVQMISGPSVFGSRMMPRMVNQQHVNYYWDTQYELYMICLESVYNRARTEYDKINKSLKFLPGMAELRAEGEAVARNTMISINNTHMQSMETRSKILSDMNEHTTNIQREIAANNAASQNRIANRTSEMIRGVETYYGTDGSIVEAPIQYDHVYQNRNNPNIIAAQQGQSLEFGVDFEELQRTNGDY